ncbi:DUF4142 domain-containing protein [Bryobacter aggregatus]|uniref:DUF4142 domain-containing protein n=1 Tax=Bryobacter aggregatus TaxID=360054 RepID=UPI0004E25282|nr:DUF4142 domain-containing protein [Bryobacter aggregatus]
MFIPFLLVLVLSQIAPEKNRDRVLNDSDATTSALDGSVLSDREKDLFRVRQDLNRGVALAQSVPERSSNPRVLGFAQGLLENQISQRNRLQETAKIPAVAAEMPPPLDRQEGAEPEDPLVANLARLKGADFDRAYMEIQIRELENGSADLQRLMKTPDRDLKSWAGVSFKETQRNLDRARLIAKEIRR